MFKNMAGFFVFEHEVIKTTLPKSKELYAVLPECLWITFGEKLIRLESSV